MSVGAFSTAAVGAGLVGVPSRDESREVCEDGAADGVASLEVCIDAEDEDAMIAEVDEMGSVG